MDGSTVTTLALIAAVFLFVSYAQQPPADILIEELVVQPAAAASRGCSACSAAATQALAQRVLKPQITEAAPQGTASWSTRRTTINPITSGMKPAAQELVQSLRSPLGGAAPQARMLPIVDTHEKHVDYIRKQFLPPNAS